MTVQRPEPREDRVTNTKSTPKYTNESYNNAQLKDNDNHYQNTPNNYTPKNTKICANCENIGHTIEECRKRRYRMQNQGKKPHGTDSGKRGRTLGSTERLPRREVKRTRALSTTSARAPESQI